VADSAPVPSARPRAASPVSEPSAPVEDSVATWTEQADRARREGRFGDAVAPLEEVAARGGPRGALASYTLGRLYMDELQQPARAAEALALALALGLPANLEEPARHRRVQALRRSDVLGAEDAARDYLEAHPAGPHAEEVRSWLDAR
jgi:transmembrane sensor